VDVGTLTLSAVYNGVTYTATFAVSKNKVGYEIVGTLPSTNLFAGRMVFLTSDSKLYRYTGSAWTTAVPTSDLSGQVISTQISDDAITTAKLAADSVTTNKIAAGQVTAGKIYVTDLSSLTANIGTLTAGTIRNTADTFRVDVTNGRTITQTGSFMKVTGAPFGSSSQFIEWYGPYVASLSSCT
jgi:hypothetical protein